MCSCLSLIFRNSRDDIDTKVCSHVTEVYWDPGFQVKSPKTFHIFLEYDCIIAELKVPRCFMTQIGFQEQGF